ncbi:hypothetical protein [Aquimarina aquimarini]|uniref:hypothetical protein n=1 Tax=Aquimarina aquimarini TaxID=1191734 RepID=UPI000D551E6B|nr:hypothetical protein [Aquimarina aquimarini]
MKTIIIPTIATLFLLSSCTNTQTNDTLIAEARVVSANKGGIPDFICKNTRNNLNISVLLDLSDRIGYPNQRENDLKHIQSISRIFKNHVMQKKSILLEDHLQVFFEPDPSPDKTDEIITKLKFGITRKTNTATIQSIEKSYKELPPKLYKWADEASHTKKGADIWRFFKDDVTGYCIEECHRNILIILTDGYLYHKDKKQKNKNRTTYINQKLLAHPTLNMPDWETFIEKRDMGILWNEKPMLKNLEILVLGIDRHESKNSNAEEIISYYWSNWFKEMGAQKFKIKRTGKPAHLEKVIQDFIHNKY